MSDKAFVMGDIRQDPSMEDILASIKRVIAEDGRAAGARAARRLPRETNPQAAEASAPDDILELEDPVGGPGSGESDGLLSPDAAAASRQQLAALSALRDRSEPSLPAAGEGALEAVVRDMLRPMLKDWLDQNLPEIVEELVTREISRITGRNL